MTIRDLRDMPCYAKPLYIKHRTGEYKYYKEKDDYYYCDGRIGMPLICWASHSGNFDEEVQEFYKENKKMPQRYIINKGATILFWEGGNKTIVKRSKNDAYDKRLGFLTAYFQKHCGMSKNKANKFLDSLEEEE